MEKKVTKTAIEAMSPGDTIWDTEVNGFGARCQKRAKKYVLKTRVGGKQRYFTIGTHGSPWTAEKARIEAKLLLGRIASGATVGDLRSEKNKGTTIRDLGAKFLADYAVLHKKPRSIRSDESNLANHIYPLLGDRCVGELTTADMDAFMLAVASGKTAAPSRAKIQKGGSVPKGGKGVANRCRALLSKMFNLAEGWGWETHSGNPVTRCKAFKENTKERFLSDDEMDRLLTVLPNFEANRPYAIAAIRLLVLTGARRSEVLELKWSYVDFDRRFLTLPDSKTGKKVIHLSAEAIELLKSIRKIAGNPYVFCGRKQGRHLCDLNGPWRAIRAEAGIEDVRLHDLRHTFASMAAASGISLQIIGKMLGHKSVLTTQRYAHLGDDVVANANDLVGARIGTLGSGVGRKKLALEPEPVA